MQIKAIFRSDRNYKNYKNSNDEAEGIIEKHDNAEDDFKRGNTLGDMDVENMIAWNTIIVHATMMKERAVIESKLQWT
ncbi:hypothetical protein AK88_05511 [Plasmodium fragile]|uniref:Uncharacterized protein n=1 Tax=Plasmodium fragile TaxID=5857 RepID=A0A0D9QGK4_PLAFR|nr:uncharacterized protein AK88_05511 [Plasmodium fragile]KJP84856.1 hypothetical protein AK88_05511 [Plasmodium fragile]